MDDQTQSPQLLSARLTEAKNELFTAFHDELVSQVADARSQASTAHSAQIELLRSQLQEMQQEASKHQQALEAQERRAVAAETAHAESEAELKRVGEAAALVSAELLASSEASEKTQAENTLLTEQLKLETEQRKTAEQQLEQEREARGKTEDALLDATAKHELDKQSLTVAARAREEALAGQLREVQARTQAALDAARLP